MRRRRLKKKIEWAVKHGFYDGFYDYIYGHVQSHPILEFSSTSGVYHLNPAVSIGYRHGQQEGKRALELRKKANFESGDPWGNINNMVPFKEAYDKMELSVKYHWRLRREKVE